MLAVALCVMAGTWCGLSLDVSPQWLLGVSALGLAGWGLLLFAPLEGARLARGRAVGGFLLIFGLAWTHADQRFRHRHAADALLQDLAPGRVAVVGRVDSDPVPTDSVDGRPGPLRFTFRLEEIGDLAGDRESVAGTVAVALYGGLGDATPAFGQRWRLAGSLRFAPDRHAAPEDPDRRMRPRRRPGRFYLNVSRREAAWRRSARGWRRAVAAAFRGRVVASERLRIGIGDRPAAVALIHALVLGHRGRLPDETRELFRATGTGHVFAISGLHVGIVVLLIVFVLRALGMSRENWIFVLGPSLLLYTWATGARASAVRACLMAMVYFGAPRLGRQPDALSALGLAAIVILAAAPTELFELGFIFSFTVVAGLIVLYPFFHKRLNRIGAPEPWTVATETDRSGTRRGEGLRQGLLSLIALSISAWIMAAPLSAHFFGRWTPVALIGNLWTIPLVFLIVVTGGLTLTLGMCLSLLADIFNHANLALAEGLVRSVAVLHAVPFGHVQGPHLPGWLLAAWYGLWLTLVRCASPPPAAGK